MKFENINSDGSKSLIDSQIDLNPHYSEIIVTNERIMILYTKSFYYDNQQYLILYSDEMIWKRFPFSKISLLNKGGIIVVLNKTANTIMYTFDEGKSYYSLSLCDEYQSIHGLKTIGENENEALMIHGRNRNQSLIIITRVDFTSIFS
ncbi:hypothetical protein RF11_03345 [Thelohanellus kitauei]|uniref:Uncharacterized protein n=1 Tax=Thelohanellus kitauei TaxID=669202 RepID=A0A0C2IAF2_THEKT|nr:hypothetical protein RF11_03345 [Thelohanellus kitauei]